MTEKYVRLVQDMFASIMILKRCTIGVTDGFKVEVELHQGYSLSCFWFALVMDRLTARISMDNNVCRSHYHQVEEYFGRPERPG